MCAVKGYILCFERFESSNDISGAIIFYLVVFSLQLSVALSSVPQLMAKLFSLLVQSCLALWPPTHATMALYWLVPVLDPASPMASGLGMPPLAIVSDAWQSHTNSYLTIILVQLIWLGSIMNHRTKRFSLHCLISSLFKNANDSALLIFP